MKACKKFCPTCSKICDSAKCENFFKRMVFYSMMGSLLLSDSKVLYTMMVKKITKELKEDIETFKFSKSSPLTYK